MGKALGGGNWAWARCLHHEFCLFISSFPKVAHTSLLEFGLHLRGQEDKIAITLHMLRSSFQNIKLARMCSVLAEHFSSRCRDLSSTSVKPCELIKIPCTSSSGDMGPFHQPVPSLTWDSSSDFTVGGVSSTHILFVTISKPCHTQPALHGSWSSCLLQLQAMVCALHKTNAFSTAPTGTLSVS